MSTFGFLLQVTCLSLRRRLRSEASVGEVCFDVVLASCCKGKRIPERDEESSQSSVSRARHNCEVQKFKWLDKRLISLDWWVPFWNIGVL